MVTGMDDGAALMAHRAPRGPKSPRRACCATSAWGGVVGVLRTGDAVDQYTEVAGVDATVFQQVSGHPATLVTDPLLENGVVEQIHRRVAVQVG